MSKDKPTPFLATKNLCLRCSNLSFFDTQPSFSVQYLFSASVTLSYKFKSSITVFKKKNINGI